MKTILQPSDLMFDVESVPVEAVHGHGEAQRRIAIPRKKALLRAGTQRVLGVVGHAYRVVTNPQAVDIAFDVCARAFPGSTRQEWEVHRVSAPSTLTYAFIDLRHRTHVLNLLGNNIHPDDPYTPFLRVTNSFNGARALRFDLGFLREHCSNGVIFEEAVATLRAAHSDEALEQLKVDVTVQNLDQLWKDFSGFLTAVRDIAMTEALSREAVRRLVGASEPAEDDPEPRRRALEELGCDLDDRLTGYRATLGENAYAVFNTVTDVAARPPDCAIFRKDRDTLEKRAGRWLKHLAHAATTPDFDVSQHLALPA